MNSTHRIIWGDRPRRQRGHWLLSGGLGAKGTMPARFVLIALFCICVSPLINPCGLFSLSAQAVPDSLGWTTSFEGDKEPSAREYYIRGLFHLQNGDYGEALESLQSAHTRLPEEPAVNHALSDTYVGLGDGVNAEYYAKTAVTLAPENIWYHLSLAGIYKTEGRTEAVLDTYRKAQVHHPDNLTLLEPMADAFEQLGELGRANEVYDQILRKQGGTVPLFMKLYWNHRALGEEAEAMEALMAIREMEPDNLVNLRLMASNYMEQGRTEEAYAILTELKNRNERDIQSMLMLVEFHLQQGEWDAFREVAEALIRDPFFYPSDKLGLVRYVVAVMEEEQDAREGQLPQERYGLREDAVQNADDGAVPADGAGTNTDAYMNRGSDDVLQGHVEQLVLLFATEEPEYAPAQDLLTTFYRASSRDDLALRNLQTVNRTTPENADAWAERIAILFRLERFDELISVADSAKRYLPDDAQTLYQTGYAHLLLGNTKTAIEWLENASYSPAPSTLRSAIHLDLANAYLVDAYHTNAQLVNANPVNSYPVNANPLHALTQDENHLREALRNYERALRLQASNLGAEAGLRLVNALQTENKDERTQLLQEAIQLWEQVAAEDPARAHHFGLSERAAELLEGS